VIAALGAPLGALVASDPTGDLPGAAREQRALQAMLEAHSAALLVRWLDGARATRSALLKALRNDRLDLLHFAGHAFFEPDAPERSGLVCAEGKVLHGSDLAGIAELPALVFCNACEAGRVRRARRSRTTGLAEAFLDGGVANFLGTHWPVDDASALAFSTVLYRRLLAGDPLGTAVRLARRAVLERGSADWANYIHYGDASFRFRP
jgi:CHAT domain-containing protein